MIDYAIKHPDKLVQALLEHVEILILTMLLSVIIAIVLTILALASDKVSRSLIYMFSILYSIPSLALFAIMIPVTGLGKTTAITVLIAYNQYILLRQFIAALNHVFTAFTSEVIKESTLISLFEHIQKHGIVPPIARVFTLEEIGKAHLLMESNTANGKIVISNDIVETNDNFSAT
ncbi:zinc-binding dehydrogenase [Paenibacillus sp. FSL P4-0176]|uniref:zinc-binding dehydrogenase n=1 Tax=Paenibacillus sp. FSL P4-0176 TaxID=2921631 RepID=UPI0030D16978